MYDYLIFEYSEPYLCEYIIRRDGIIIASAYGHRTREAAESEALDRIRLLKGESR